MPTFDESHLPPAESRLKGLFRLISAAFQFVFACRHPRTSLPYNNRQTCLSCGCTRSYIFSSDFEHAAAGIEIGRWRKPLIPRNTARQVARRSVELSAKAVR